MREREQRTERTNVPFFLPVGSGFAAHSLICGEIGRLLI